MAPGEGSPAESEPAGIVIERVFSAPRGAVWGAWTEPERFKQWYGPEGVHVPTCTIDLRVGGRYLIDMRMQDGSDLWLTGIFREIVPNERLVSSHALSDEHGNVVSPAERGMGDEMPVETMLSLTFEEAGDGRTKFSLEHTGVPGGMMSEYAAAGWNQALDKLAVTLGSV